MEKVPESYGETNERLNKIEERQKRFGGEIDSVLVNQGRQMSQIREIHYLLAGTEYEKNNGGLVGDMKRLKTKVSKNTLWRTRMVATGAAVAGVIGFVLLRFNSIINIIKGLVSVE